MKFEMKNIYMIMVLSLFVLGLSLFIPKEINTLEELNYIEIGFPKPFVIQQSSLTPLENDFPIYFMFGDIWDNPAKFLFKNFILSYLYITVWLICLYLLFKNIYRLIKRYNNS